MVQRTILFAAVFLLCLLLAGNSAAAQETIEDNLRAADSTPQPGAVLELDLQECILYCVQHHPDMQVAGASIRSARGKLKQVLASYYPDVNYTGSYTHTSGRAGFIADDDISPQITTSGENYAHRLSLRQYIWDFGKTPAQVEAVRRQLDAEIYSSVTTVNNLIANLKKQYYLYIGAQEVERVNQLQLEVQQLHLVEAKNFYDQGKKAKNEVTQAEVNVANSHYTLIKSEKDRYNVYLKLKNLMGVKDESFNFNVKRDLSIEPVGMTLEEIQRLAEEHRPELSRYDALIAAQNYTIKGIRAEYFPSISGETGFSWSGKRYPLDRSFSAGISVSLNIFDGGTKIGRLEDALAQLESLQAQREGMRQDIVLEVGQAYNTLVEARLRMDVAAKASELAKENYELAKGRYEAGLSSNTEFNDARYSMFEADTNLISAAVDYLTAYADLEKSIGEQLNLIMRRDANE